jgi:hypothetical protein
MLDEEVGTLVVPRASVAVCRNYDFDFGGPSSSTADGPAYRISRPVRRLHWRTLPAGVDVQHRWMQIQGCTRP